MDYLIVDFRIKGIHTPYLLSILSWYCHICISTPIGLELLDNRVLHLNGNFKSIQIDINIFLYLSNILFHFFKTKSSVRILSQHY